MDRPLVRFSKVFASLSVVACVCLSAPSEASAQEVVVQPDAAYIATAEPVYYNGAAHYWYRNHWYYRNGGTWAGYRGGEPGYLHDYRFRTWPGGVYHAGYHYNAGYHGGYHGGGGGHRR
jgi:hypothetical protein